MSVDIRVEGGSRSDSATGKYSSILEYLDHVSDDAKREQQQQQQQLANDDDPRAVPRAVVGGYDVGLLSSASSVSSISSSGAQHRHQDRRRQRRKSKSCRSSRPADGDPNAEGWTRPAWDNSTKDRDKMLTKTVSPSTTASSSNQADFSAALGRRRRSRTEAVNVVQREQILSPNRNSQDKNRRTRSNTAARDSPRNCPHPDVVNRRFSAAVGGEPSPTASANTDDHVTYEERESRGFDKTLGYTSKTRTEAPPATVGGTAGQRQRRWVWDEWGDTAGGPFSHSPLPREPTPTAVVESSSSSLLGKPVNCSTSAHDPPVLHKVDAANYATQPNNREWFPPAARRGRGEAGVVGVDDEKACAPAVKQAFEDVQATARSMKADLKQRRSEVLDLKTNLQRVRTSNERRRAKVSERWVVRMTAAAEERRTAAERHRNFARQLKADVDALEGKLGGLERQVGRSHEGRERDCALARAECARELKKAREAWMSAEKGRLQRLSDKKAGGIKQAAIRALEPQLSELVKTNRAEARARVDELEEVLLGLQASLEREATEKVQTGARDYQASLEGEVEEERRQAEHQLRLLARSNEADIQEFREAARRDIEGERVRFEADRKRSREAAAKDLERAKAGEADRSALALAEHARELREAEETYRREEEETRRRLAEETDRWQKQVRASARKEAEERDELAKREAREKFHEEMDTVLTRLEAEASQARKEVRSQAQQAAGESAALRGKDLEAAKEMETRAMERYLDCARRQAELESETKGLEQEIKATEEHIRVDTERLAAAEQQHKEGRERWGSRLERLQEECSDERRAAREEVSRLSDTAEEAEGAARRAVEAAEEELAGLKASLAAEFAQVEAKIEVVLNRKTEQVDNLKKRLSVLQTQTKAREEELSDHRRRTFS